MVSLFYNQDYKVTWWSTTPLGEFRLVCWSGIWNIFLNKVFFDDAYSFNEGLAKIEAHIKENCPRENVEQ